MADSNMRGAGNHGETRENVPVHSKAQRHGIPRHPAPVTVAGMPAPMPASPKAGYNERGHMQPRDMTPMAEGHKVTNHPASTMGAPMYDGVGMGIAKNAGQTDRITHHTGPKGQSGMVGGGQEQPRRDPAGIQPAGREGPGYTRLGTQGRVSERPTTSDNTIRAGSRRQDAGALAGNPGDRKGYTGGRGKI